MNIKICPKCGGKVSKTLKECPHCGHYFKKTKKCPDCEEQIEFDLDICPICGHVFNKKKKVKQEKPLEDDNDIVEEIESIEDNESKEEKIVKPTKIINNEDLLTHSSKCPYCGSNTQIDLGDGIFECLICHNTIVSKPIHKNKHIIDNKKDETKINDDKDESIEENTQSISQEIKKYNQPSNGGKKKKSIFITISLLIIAAITAALLAIYLPRCANKNAWLSKVDWWNYCSNGKDGEQATAADIGREVELTVNNQIHKVRLIGIEHDGLYNSSGKAHCTFEFSNLLSDSSGYSLATLWESRNGTTSTNYDYFNSDLRRALDGRGTGTLRWYQKGAATKSTTYTTSVYSMLPSGLQSKLKEVKKYVATTSSYTVTNYNAKVFALTHNEMTKYRDSYALREGTTYQYYYKDHDDNSSYCVKHQIKWHDGAVTSYKEIDDLSWHPYNYAGHNGSTDRYRYGGEYWLASPYYTSSNYGASRVDVDGRLYYTPVYGYAYAVAPAFCI